MGIKLLVIDSKSYETMYRRKLLSTKVDLSFTESANDSIENLNTYDLVIISHLLKNGSGVDVYNKLRSLGYSGDIVIACCNGEEMLRPSYNGISGLISKTTNSEDFSSYICNIIQD